MNLAERAVQAHTCSTERVDEKRVVRRSIMEEAVREHASKVFYETLGVTVDPVDWACISERPSESEYLPNLATYETTIDGLTFLWTWDAQFGRRRLVAQMGGAQSPSLFSLDDLGKFLAGVDA